MSPIVKWYHRYSTGEGAPISVRLCKKKKNTTLLGTQTDSPLSATCIHKPSHVCNSSISFVQEEAISDNLCIYSP